MTDAIRVLPLEQLPFLHKTAIDKVMGLEPRECGHVIFVIDIFKVLLGVVE